MTSPQDPPETSHRAGNRCRFGGSACANGERTFRELYMRPLRRRPTARRQRPSSRGPDPLQ